MGDFSKESAAEKNSEEYVFQIQFWVPKFIDTNCPMSSGFPEFGLWK